MKLFEKIRSRVLDPAGNLRDRVFLVLTISASSIVVLALLGDLVFGENIVEIIVLAVTLFTAPTGAIIGVRTGKVEIASRIISMGLVLIVMPAVYFFGGGLRGGVVPWLVFAYLYMGLMLVGWWRVLSIAVHTMVIILMFYVGYYYPELVKGHTEEMYYVDMLLAVIEVGMVCFIMTWFQNLLFMAENKRAKEETRKVEELNRSQNRFFSSMSHEIRTPINSILGLNEIILRQEDASEEIVKDASNIQGAGRMLLSLINDILDFSKIEAGKMDIVPVNYSVAALVSEIVNMMWMRAEQKGLKLRVEVDPTIPAELYGDEIRIKQILINLLNNAVKYTQEGTVTLRIEREEFQGDQIVLMFTVVDTGIGIKQDALPYLFDAFHRVDEENNNKIEGTGLGLSIVKQLVELMDGRVTVNSVYTQGTTFIVTLRQKVARPDAVGEINIAGSGIYSTEGRYEPGFTAPDVRVLIVDDNEMNLEVEKKLLSSTGILVDTAVSGKDAILLTKENHYDLILMDHLMPEMDGIECMQHIRKQVGGMNNRVPIVVLTANAGSENRELYARSGFDDYLIKPVSGRQLEEMIIAHISSTKIIRSDITDPAKQSMNTARTYSRKVPVIVAVGSMCDLPRSIYNEYQLDVIPFELIHGDNIFYDSEEATQEELIRYMSEGEEFDSRPPSVRDFEKFFGGELKKAHNVIYISSGAGISEEYNNARAAARIYGNVSVIDSGSSSAAVGILALIAIRMATRGDGYEKIIREISFVRNKINSSFITDGAYFLLSRGVVDKNIASFISTLSLNPFIRYKGERFRVEKLVFGESEKRYLKYIDYALPRYADPDPDFVFVIYVDLDESTREFIEEHIKKRFEFRHIIFQKASAILSLYSGPGAIGLIYLEKGDYSYGLSNMLSFYDNLGDEGLPEEAQEDDRDRAPMHEPVIYESPAYTAASRSVEADTAPLEWYELIPGLDSTDAIKSCGSAESYEMVLRIFYENIPVKFAEIEDLFEKENWGDYVIKIHALKSSAKLAGATALAKDALELEMAGKEGRTDYIIEHHREVMDELLEFKTPLSEHFADLEDEDDDGFISV